MHETEKLNEGKYFFDKMCDVTDDPSSFHYELSAFLSSARSILQYGNEEAKTRSDGQTWYDKRVSGNSILKFFKNKRDINIHIEPVKTIRNILVSITEHVHISDSINIEVQRKDGLEKIDLKGPTPQPVVKHDDSTVSFKYIFSDWGGVEDVIELCGKYIKELEKFIKNGQSKGFIT